MPRDTILILYAYPKSEQDDLTAGEDMSRGVPQIVRPNRYFLQRTACIAVMHSGQ